MISPAAGCVASLSTTWFAQPAVVVDRYWKIFQRSPTAGSLPEPANLTVPLPAVAGWVAMYPGDVEFPGLETIQFKANQVRANNVTMALSGDGSGTITLRNNAGTVNVVLDVNGYYQ